MKTDRTITCVYHVLSARCGEQLFEDQDMAKAKARAMDFLDELVEHDDPVTIWLTSKVD